MAPSTHALDAKAHSGLEPSRHAETLAFVQDLLVAATSFREYILTHAGVSTAILSPK